ncbi:MAG: 50S ribosomal protein L25 [bacterium]
MTTFPTLSCSLRTSTGSNVARQMRQKGLLPATVYGHGASVSITMEQKHFVKVALTGNSGSQIVHLDVDGTDGGLALVKNVQKNMLAHVLTHVDLQRVSLTDSLQIPVPLVLDGDAAGVLIGGVLDVYIFVLNLKCAASAVPESIHYDISNLQVNEHLTVSQIPLPEGCELLDRPEDTIAVIRLKAE